MFLMTASYAELGWGFDMIPAKSRLHNIHLGNWLALVSFVRNLVALPILDIERLVSTHSQKKIL